MKIFHLFLLAGLCPARLLAQHDEHAAVAPAASPQSSSSEQAAQMPIADPNAGHFMSATPPDTKPAEDADPHAGHDTGATPATTAPDSHAGHVMPTSEAAPPETAPMAGHDMSAMAGESATALPEAPPPPEAFSGPEHAADTLFDPVRMARARADIRNEHGNIRTYWIAADQLETRIRDGENGYLWDAQGWYGGDINKLWVKTEGEGEIGESPETVEVQLLWSRAIRPWWDFQAGVRQDFRPSPKQTHLVVGIQGLVPYQFELDAAAFLSDEGDLSARVEAEYDQWLTQRLLLQPRFEFDMFAQDVPELGIGSGVSSAELGLRLRYQIAREFAPYIGVEYESRFGTTADFVRAAGGTVSGWNFVVGVRTWF